MNAEEPVAWLWEAQHGKPDQLDFRPVPDSPTMRRRWKGRPLVHRAERVWTMHDGKSVYPREPGVMVICRDGREREATRIAAHYAFHDGDRLDVMAWSISK